MGRSKERKNNGKKGTKEHERTIGEQCEDQTERKNNRKKGTKEDQRNERTMEGSEGRKEQWEIKKNTNVKIFVTIVVFVQLLIKKPDRQV